MPMPTSRKTRQRRSCCSTTSFLHRCVTWAGETGAFGGREVHSRCSRASIRLQQKTCHREPLHRPPRHCRQAHPIAPAISHAVLESSFCGVFLRCDQKFGSAAAEHHPKDGQTCKSMRLRPQPPESPGLARCDCWLFPRVKMTPRGKCFELIQDIGAAATAHRTLGKENCLGK